MDAAQLFKALSDTLSLPQPKISHHLATLRRAGLVTDRKTGLWVYYRLTPDLPEWVSEVLRSSATGVATEEPYGSDELTLQDMPNRPGAACSA